MYLIIIVSSVIVVGCAYVATINLHQIFSSRQALASKTNRDEFLAQVETAMMAIHNPESLILGQVEAYTQLKALSEKDQWSSLSSAVALIVPESLEHWRRIVEERVQTELNKYQELFPVIHAVSSSGQELFASYYKLRKQLVVYGQLLKLDFGVMWNNLVSKYIEVPIVEDFDWPEMAILTGGTRAMAAEAMQNEDVVLGKMALSLTNRALVQYYSCNLMPELGTAEAFVVAMMVYRVSRHGVDHSSRQRRSATKQLV